MAHSQFALLRFIDICIIFVLNLAVVDATTSLTSLADKYDTYTHLKSIHNSDLLEYQREIINGFVNEIKKSSRSLDTTEEVVNRQHQKIRKNEGEGAGRDRSLGLNWFSGLEPTEEEDDKDGTNSEGLSWFSSPLDDLFPTKEEEPGGLNWFGTGLNNENQAEEQGGHNENQQQENAGGINWFGNLYEEEVEEAEMNEGSFGWFGNDDFLTLVDNINYIDYRDLLVTGEESIQLGGSGKDRYGQGLVFLLDTMERLLLQEDDDGTLLANDLMIRDITREQSGTPGMVYIPGEVFDFDSEPVTDELFPEITDMSTFRYKMTDLRVRNVDTMVMPVSIWEPTKNPWIVNNMISFGPVPGRRVNGTIVVDFELFVEEDSPFNFRDVVEIGMSTGSFQIFFELMTKVSEFRALEFPLSSFLIPECWLSTMPAPMLDNDGYRIKKTPDRGMSFKSFEMEISDTAANVRCIHCKSGGSQILPDIMKILDESRVVFVLGERFEVIAKDFVLSDYFQIYLDRVIHDAPKFCPHTPFYNKSAVETDYPDAEIFPMSPVVIDGAVFLGFVAAEVSVAMLSETFLGASREEVIEEQDPLSLQKSWLNNSSLENETYHLIDFTNLEPEFGVLADVLFRASMSYIGLMVKDPETGKVGLAINMILEKYFLMDTNGVATFHLDVSFEQDRILFLFDTLNVTGLDTFTHADLMNPIGPQTIQSNVSIEHLNFEFFFTVDDLRTSDPKHNYTVTFDVYNITAEPSLFAAIDYNLLGLFQIGSFLSLDDLLSCFIAAQHAFEFTKMKVSIGDVSMPKVEGLMPDTNFAFLTSLNRIWKKYARSNLIEATPPFYDLFGSDIMNDFLEIFDNRTVCRNQTEMNIYNDTEYLDLDNHSAVNDSDTEYIDFEDLFNFDFLDLYGIIISTIYGVVDSLFYFVDPNTDLPMINSAMIAPLTKRLSGVEGTFGFDDLFVLSIDGSDLALLNPFGIESIKFSLGTTYENMNTIVRPSQVLEINTTDSYLLDNNIRFGTVDNSTMRILMDSFLEITGDSPLAMRDEMQASLTIRDMHIFAVLFAKLRVQDFNSYGIGDLLDLDCALVNFAIQVAEWSLDKTGSSLRIDYLKIHFSSIVAKLACVKCTSDLFRAFPTVNGEIVEGDDEYSLILGLADVVLDLIGILPEHGIIDVLRDMSKVCNGSDNFFDLLTATSPSKWLSVLDSSLGALSEASGDKLSGAVTRVLDIIGGPLVDSLQAMQDTVMDPVVKNQQLQVPPDVNLIDFTELGEPPETIFDLLTSIFDDVSLSAILLKELPIGNTTQFIIDHMNRYMSAPLSDGIMLNALVNGILHNGTMSVSQEMLQEFLPEVPGVTLSAIRLSGLDSFSHFHVLNATAPQTFHNEFSLKHLSLTIQLTFDGEFGNRMLLEDEIRDVSITLGFNDVNVSSSILVAVDSNILAELQVGSLLHIDRLLPCIASTSHALEITELDVRMGGMDDVLFEGAFEFLNDILKAEEFDSVLSLTPSISNGFIRESINAFMDLFLDMEVMECKNDIFFSEPSSFVDLRDLLETPSVSKSYGGIGEYSYGDLVPTVINLLQVIKDASPIDGKTGFNEFLFGTSTDDVFYKMPGELYKLDMPITPPGSNEQLFQLYLGLSDLTFENFNTLGDPLSFLDLVMNSPYEIENGATIGVGGEGLRTSVRVILKLEGEDLLIHNDFKITVDLYEFTFLIRSLSKILEQRLMTFPLKDIMNLDCWLATIPAPLLDYQGVRFDNQDITASVTSIAASVEKVNLNVSCFSCTGPLLIELGEILNSPDGSEDLSRDINNILNYIETQLGGDFVQDQLDQMLNNAVKRCPHSPGFVSKSIFNEYEPFPISIPKHANNGVLAILTIMCIALTGVAVTLLVMKRFVRNRHKVWLESLPSDRIFLIENQQRIEDEMQASLNTAMHSMFRSPQVPASARYGIPIIILGNIAFFLSGHLSLGGAVNIALSIFGQSIELNLFPFSIGRSIFEMFKQGQLVIPLIATLMSIIWPYLKQLISLAFWFLPPHIASVSTRGHVYIWLDKLAKWSMLDVFVIISSVAGVWVQIENPNAVYLPTNFYEIDVLLVPMWGLYANMIAQLISQISSHFIIYYHRKTVSYAIAEYETTHNVQRSSVHSTIRSNSKESCSIEREVDIAQTPNEEKDAEGDVEADAEADAEVDVDTETLINLSDGKELRLCDYAFTRWHRGENEKLLVYQWVNVLIATSAVLVCILIMVGATYPTYVNEAFGVVALLLKFGRGESASVAEYSVWDITAVMKRMGDVAGLNHAVGTASMSALLVFSVVIVPIVQTVALCYQWFMPLTRRKREQMVVLIETLQAWQYCDVYLISLILETWRQESSTAVLWGVYCNDFNEVFAKLNYYGFLDENDAQCMQIETAFGTGAYLFLVAVLLLVGIESYVIDATEQYLKDTEPKLVINENLVEKKDVTEAVEKIHQVTVLFTDKFRWTLRSKGCIDSISVNEDSNENGQVFVATDDEYGDEKDPLSDISA